MSVKLLFVLCHVRSIVSKYTDIKQYIAKFSPRMCYWEGIQACRFLNLKCSTIHPSIGYLHLKQALKKSKEC